MSLLPGIIALGLLALVALRLAWQRPPLPDAKQERIAASRALALATAVQGMHFAEEWATGFHIRFPALFGLEPIPLSVFVAFNLCWIVIWIASIPAVQAARRFAFFAAWFLALAGMLNGIAHPLLAVATGGYFPGLLTSPFIGLAGLLLFRRMTMASQAPAQWQRN